MNKEKILKTFFGNLLSPKIAILHFFLKIFSSPSTLLNLLQDQRIDIGIKQG